MEHSIIGREVTVQQILDLKLSPCFICSAFSFGEYLPGVWVLKAFSTQTPERYPKENALNTWLFLPIVTSSLLACCQLLTSQYSHWHKFFFLVLLEPWTKRHYLPSTRPELITQKTRRNIPENLQLRQQCCENLKLGVVTKAPHPTLVIIYTGMEQSQNTAVV